MGFLNDKRGIIGVFSAKGGEDLGLKLNLNDEVVFVDASNVRKNFRFIELGDVKSVAGVPTRTNYLQF